MVVNQVQYRGWGEMTLVLGIRVILLIYRTMTGCLRVLVYAMIMQLKAFLAL